MSRPSSGSRCRGESGSGDSERRDDGREKKLVLHQRTESEAAATAVGQTEATATTTAAIRPTSLYGGQKGCGGDATPADIGSMLQPEREPLRFDVNLVGAPYEVELLVNNIKRVAEQFLYHWKTFPIVLPASIADAELWQGKDEIYETLSRKHRHHLKDLFIVPSFDELDLVAVDGKGEPKKLSGKQLESVRERGWFEVESLNFPGQRHVWRVSEALQKGRERTRESLMRDLALAVRLIVVTARGRLIGGRWFSVTRAARSLLAGLARLLDLAIGVPSLRAHDLEARLREERCRYLVAELVCRAEHEESLETLCRWVRARLRSAATEKEAAAVDRNGAESDTDAIPPPPAVPYHWLTTAGAELDLRLYERALVRRALPALAALLERETRGWFLHFRERLVAEMRARKMRDADIEREANEAVQHEYLQRVYQAVAAHADLHRLGDGVPQLLVQQARSHVLMRRAVESVQARLGADQRKTRERVTRAHPLLARVKPWLRARLRSAERRFVAENEWSAHEEALALCTSQRLYQTAYFLGRDLAFMREREPALARELRAVRTPTRTYHWRTQIWLPRNWIVRRHFRGRADRVPTVLSARATSITTPRSDPSQPVYLVERETVRATTTRWPLWRLFNYCHRTWCWTWNAMFFFGVLVPWCSPLGLRALFARRPFMPDLELSQVNGTLTPRRTSLTPTLCSRLSALWRHISKARTRFETEPDTGFIGKGLARHANRAWNYAAKGACGTFALALLFPLACLAACVGSALLAATACLWVPLVTLAVQASNALVYDLDCPRAADGVRAPNRYCVLFEALVWRVFVLGLLQPAAALGVAALLCPAAALLALLCGATRYVARRAWDAVVFRLVIAGRGRVPSRDSLAVRRIAGPGLAADYYFRIGPEQALAALEARLEMDELAAWQRETEARVLRPQRDLAHFVDACFGPFSARLAEQAPTAYERLDKEARDLLAALRDRLEVRRRRLHAGLGVGVKSRVRLTTADLQIALQQGALMLERHYPTRVLTRLANSGMTDDSHQQQWWEGRGLAAGDWAGLAGLLYSELFSLDVLTPLGEADTSFRLETHPQADLERYAEMVRSARLGAAAPRPDLLGHVYAPRGNVHVRPPHLDAAAFNPRSSSTAVAGRRPTDEDGGTTGSGGGQGRRRWTLPWKGRPAVPYAPDKLVIPLPVPHPVHIAVTIYNRDTDDPIPLESDVCQEVLRAIEESHAPAPPAEPSVAPPDGYETASSSSEGAVDGGGGYQWTLGDWGGGGGPQQRRPRTRNDSGSVHVDLASPEDITLDTDSSRAHYTTTV